MDVLTTRVLSYPDEEGNTKELLLTIFMPYEVEGEQAFWKCGFLYGPPIQRMNKKITESGCVDFPSALVACLGAARGYLEGELRGRAHWQGMHDCGLPWHRERPASFVDEKIPPPGPNPGNMVVLGTRGSGYIDEDGVDRDLLLTIFTPFKAEDEVWKCGFTFDPLPNATIRYGVGADFIEAFLDCLVKARVTYEGMMRKDWKPPETAFDCADFPYKIGRSFWTVPASPEPW